MTRPLHFHLSGNWRRGHGAACRNAGRKRASRDGLGRGRLSAGFNAARRPGHSLDQWIYPNESRSRSGHCRHRQCAVARKSGSRSMCSTGKFRIARCRKLSRNFFCPGHDSLVVTGTHGKTTTTSMLSWILHHAGRRPNFLIGGVAENFGRSFGLGGGNEFVLEGDEYDSAFFDKAPKFLHYHPRGSHHHFAGIRSRGYLCGSRRHRIAIPANGESGAAARTHCCLGRKRNRSRRCRRRHFARWKRTDSLPEWIGSRATWNLPTARRASAFPIEGAEVARVRMSLAGRHNVLNALSAIAIAHGRGVERDSHRRRDGDFPRSSAAAGNKRGIVGRPGRR